MSGETALERMEKQAELTFGGPKAAFGGMVDKSMLEMNDTNRWLFDANQSKLEIACCYLHQAVVNADNRKPRYKAVKDNQGQWKNERVQVDNWSWIKHLDYHVRMNQLTIGDHSRLQHLRQLVAAANIAPPDSEQGFFSRLFNRGQE